MTIKKTVKTLSALLLAGLLLEGGGYLYGLRPSDIFYHHVLYKNESREYNTLHSLITNNIEDNNHKDFLELEKSKGKYRKSVFFSSILHTIKKNNITIETIIKNIDKIYYVEKIYLNKLPAGGTYNAKKKKIYISSKRRDGRTYASKRKIIEMFHHEFSSILMHQYNANEEKWRSAFNSGFSYKSEEDPFYHIIELQGEADKISIKDLYQRGLLKQYAETGMENDFNTYAEVIFTEPRKMKKLIAEYPVIKRKYEVFKAFYLSIDPGFAPVFEKIDG